MKDKCYFTYGTLHEQTNVRWTSSIFMLYGQHDYLFHKAHPTLPEYRPGEPNEFWPRPTIYLLENHNRPGQ